MDMTGVLLGRLHSCLNRLSDPEAEQFIKSLNGADRVFVVGAGRSGLVGRFFTMRLVHMGIHAFIVGDTCTPAIKGGDVLIALSGSGKTETILHVVRKAREAGAQVLALTGKSGHKSELELLSIAAVHIDTQGAEQVQTTTIPQSVNVTPMGTLFEMSALVYLESVVGEMIARQGLSEAEMRARHANLE